MKALNNALEAFDLDSYLRYNGLKSPLQQAYNEHRVDYENMSEDELKNMLKKAISEGNATLPEDIIMSDSLRKSIKTDTWDKDTIEEYNNLIKSIQDDKIVYRRIHEKGGPSPSEVSQVHAGASLLLRASYGAAETKSRNQKEQYEAEAAQGKEQERKIEAWAKAEDLWLNDYADKKGHKAKSLEDLLNSQWTYINQGSEAEIYLYDDNNVLKSINLSHSNDNVAKALDKIALFNRLFPRTAMKVVGFGRDSLGHFRIIVTQKFIQGKELSNKELNAFLNELKESNEDGTYLTSDDVARITDLSNFNVFKNIDGNYEVIDADVMYNTPYYGGNVIFDNSLTKGNQNDLSSLIDSMTKDQLISELNHVKQEYADYDLFNYQHQTPKGKSSFTFNDDTTISTPFKPNPQQAEALNVMDDFIKSRDTSMTLSGYAGTGKTSLMEILAQKAQKDHIPIMFCATTNKAALVLNSKVEKLGFQAQTLNKLFGIRVEVDSSKAYDAKNLVNNVKETKLPFGATVIIDEASMINEENYNILTEIARRNGLKIIYVGDRGQLPPVGEDKVSIVFRNNDGKIMELTQVERTDDNAILKEATNIRNGKPLSNVSAFNDKGEGVAFINPNGKHKDDIENVIKHYVQGLKNNPDYFRILAYTNKVISQYNDHVRKLLGYNDNIPRVGEPIMGYANWGYDWRTKSYAFINAESYKVTKVDNATTKLIKIGDNAVKMTVVPITLEDSLGRKQVFNFMDIKGNAANREAATLLASMKAKLWEKARRANKFQKKDIYAQINAIDSFLFVNDNITDAQGHYLQAKTFDYGYAITVHKSQGSTFTNVLLDENDIEKARSNNNSQNILSTVDVWEENGNNPEDAVLKSSEEVDLGPDIDNGEITQQQNNDNVDMKQRLDYVGVSKATDTVTVVTDRAQKEDSPLNHLKGSIPHDIGQQANQDRQDRQAQIDKDIVQQEIDHLNSIGGIKVQLVNGQEEMMAQLSKDSNDAQMAIGRSNPRYITDELSNAEKEAIRKKVYAINEAKQSLVEVDLNSATPSKVSEHSS